MSALARLISALSKRLDRNGQSRTSRASRVQPRLAVRGPVRLEGAGPSPYQPGRLIRACDQAKVHGIARSESIVGASSRRPRAAGRDPSRRSDSSRIGVTSRKNEANPGSSWTSAR